MADARRIERDLQKRVRAFAEPPPLSVHSAAGGRSEWFRGAAQPTTAAATAMASAVGYFLHAPISAWLRERFTAWDGWYDWSSAVMERIEYVRPLGDSRGLAQLERGLRDALDAAAAVDADLSSQLPDAVRRWHGAQRLF